MSEKDESSFDQSKPFMMVVEDDSIFRNLICKELKRHGHTVRGVQNGLLAKTVFDLNPKNISLVISDLKMAEYDGVSLLKHVRNSSQVPFIVMTGFLEILDRAKAQELGANGFVPKPFRALELIEIIDRCLKPEPNAVAELEEKPQPKYCALHISEFISASVLLSDIFVRMPGGKYIRVARSGETVPVERLRKYQDKHVDYLYVSGEDFSRYVEFNIKLTSLATKAKAVSKEAKAKLIKHTSELIMAKCFVTEVDSQDSSSRRKRIFPVLGPASLKPNTTPAACGNCWRPGSFAE